MAKRECPFEEGSSTKITKVDGQEMTTKELRTLYGPVKPSPQKNKAVRMAGKETSMMSIAEALKVKVPTAEVYVLDGYVAGAPLDHQYIAQQLDVRQDLFMAVRKEIKPSLRTIKDNLERQGWKPSYNQIRFVIACLIRKVSLTL